MARQRERTSKKFSGNHQRSWLWGYHAVCETLTADRWPVLELLVTQAAYERASQVLEEKVRRGIPLQIVPGQRLEELSKSTEHQGMLARLGPFPYTDMQKLEHDLKQALDVSATDRIDFAQPNRDVPLVVMCDRLQDGFNLGAILRCCDGANVSAVIVGEKSQAEMTPHVSRSSSGAINYLPIARTNDLVETALSLKALGLKLLAADANAAESMWDAELHSPSVLVIGSESHGVDERLLNICDERVLIPMHGRVSSLNAAVASGILLYEIRRQQRQKLLNHNPTR